MASINDFEEFKNRAYLRMVEDEVDAAYVNLPVRKISTAVYTNKGLREVASYVNLQFAELHDNLLSLIERCRAEKKMEKDSIIKVYNDILKDYENIDKTATWRTHPRRKPLERLVGSVNDMMHSINHTMAYTRNAINVAKTSEKFNPVTIETLIKTGATDSYDPQIYLKLDEEFKGDDVFTAENLQVIIRKLNSFKAYVMNSFNKYFGPDSEFAEFKLNELITTK